MYSRWYDYPHRKKEDSSDFQHSECHFSSSIFDPNHPNYHNWQTSFWNLWWHFEHSHSQIPWWNSSLTPIGSLWDFNKYFLVSWHRLWNVYWSWTTWRNWCRGNGVGSVLASRIWSSSAKLPNPLIVLLAYFENWFNRVKPKIGKQDWCFVSDLSCLRIWCRDNLLISWKNNVQWRLVSIS